MREAQTPSTPRLLTVGFARRFATYKRACILFSRDLHALRRLLRQPQARCRSCWRARRTRRIDEGQERRPGPLRAAARRPGSRPRIALPRGLRHARSARDPGAGLRRLAQHAAPPARGERDERHEGRDERLPQPERARRLVGRGVTTAPTAGRSATTRRKRRIGSRTSETPTPSTRHSKSRWLRSITSATAKGCRRHGSRE